MNKICTTIEQSQKLIELGIDVNTADMYYYNSDWEWHKTPNIIESIDDLSIHTIFAWSLSALLSVLPKGTNIIKEEADTENEQYMCTVGIKNAIISTFGNNPIDACYEMIIKLHGRELL